MSAPIAQADGTTVWGAWSYESYREKRADEADGCADYGLPSWGEKEVRYISPGIEDGARWIGLQEGRRSHSVFKVLDATYDARRRVFGSEEPYTRDMLWGEPLPSYHTKETSKNLIRITRHGGCVDQDTKLGCDSGGWFKIQLLVRDLVARRPPRWARSLR